MKKILLFILFLNFISFSYSDSYNLSDLAGNQVDYENVTKENNTIFLMWTTWCPYCRKEIVNLNKNYMDYKNVSFVIVNLGEKKSKIDQFVKSAKLNPELLKKFVTDPESNLARKFNIIGIPAYVFLKNGEVIAKYNFLNKEIISEIYENE